MTGPQTTETNPRGLTRVAARMLRFGFHTASRIAASAAKWSRELELKVHSGLVGDASEPDSGTAVAGDAAIAPADEAKATIEVKTVADVYRTNAEAPDLKVEVKTLDDIPFPTVDLGSADPIAAIMATPEFGAATDFFADNPVTSRSLVSAAAQALIYCLLRNLKPDHVFEIGCFRAGTTEAMSRALHANGKGTVHTADPVYAAEITAVLKAWPPELAERVKVHAMDSMPFYYGQREQQIHPGLVFVDGNHQYEYASFDIYCAALALAPRGVIVVDNIAQAGPFFAARDFLATHSGWRELGSSTGDYDRTKAYDRHRTRIRNTDLIVLQAPSYRPIEQRPVGFGLMPWTHTSVAGLRVRFEATTAPGTIYAQVVLRGFGATLTEKLGEASVVVSPGTQEVSIAFAPPLSLDGEFGEFSVEPWLIWHGKEPLRLTTTPLPF